MIHTRHEFAKGIIRLGRRLNLADIEQAGESLLQTFEMASNPGPNHHAVGIQWLAAYGVTQMQQKTLAPFY